MSIDPGAGRPTACGVTTPPRRWPRRRTTDGALPSHHSVVRIGTRIADGDVSDFERFLTSRWALFPLSEHGRAQAFTVYAPVDHGRWPSFAANSNSTTNSSTLPSFPSRPVTRSCTGRRGPKSVSVGHGGRAVPESVSRAGAVDPDETHHLPGYPPRLCTNPSLRPWSAIRRSSGASQLEPDLVEHAQPRCSDRMTECLQATVAVDRQAAVETERTVEHISPGLAGVGEPGSSINTSSVGVKQSWTSATAISSRDVTPAWA